MDWLYIGHGLVVASRLDHSIGLWMVIAWPWLAMVGISQEEHSPIFIHQKKGFFGV